MSIDGHPQDIAALARAIVGGDRRALARAMTLCESTLPAHRRQATDLLVELRSLARSGPPAWRIGISGPAGVGKSTLTTHLATHFSELGHRVAVLAVDPSSQETGGSILGDQARMGPLSGHKDVFIRPSPSLGHLGGLARRTPDLVTLCHAGGFDLVVIESVGVGQSEIAIKDLVDQLVLLFQPASGDGLQAIKRGLMEQGDFLVVHKDDGDLSPSAHALEQILRNSDPTRRERWIGRASSVTGEGLAALWQALEAHRRKIEGSNQLCDRRAAQGRRWFDMEFRERLWEEISLRYEKSLVARNQDAAARASTLGDSCRPEVEDAVAQVVASLFTRSE